MKTAKKAAATLMTAALAASMTCAIPALATAAPAASTEVSATYAAMSTKTVKHTCTVGDKHTLTFKANGKKIKGDKVAWKSSNTKIATVKKGVITAKKAGNVTITGKYKSTTSKYKVTVKRDAKADFNAMVKELEAEMIEEGIIVEGDQKIYGKVTESEVEGGTVTTSYEYNATAGTLAVSASIDPIEGESYTIRVVISDKYADKNCTIIASKNGEAVKTVKMKKSAVKSSNLPALSDNFADAFVFAMLEQYFMQQATDNIVINGILVDLGFTSIDK